MNTEAFDRLLEGIAESYAPIIPIVPKVDQTEWRELVAGDIIAEGDQWSYDGESDWLSMDKASRAHVGETFTGAGKAIMGSGSSRWCHWRRKVERWRMLEKGEVIREGDECKMGDWHPCHIAGTKVDGLQVRRRI